MSPKMPRFVHLTTGRKLTLSEAVQQAKSALRLGDRQVQMEEMTSDNRQVNLHGGAGASCDPAARARVQRRSHKQNIASEKAGRI